MALAKTARAVAHLSRNVQAIYEEFYPDHGASLHDRLAKIENKLGIEPPVKEKP